MGSKQPIKTPAVETKPVKGKPCNWSEAAKGSEDNHHNGSHGS